jgi:small subunit ribosomal protein S4
MKHAPVAKLSRALGIPLTEKATKYFEQRPYPPGPHGRTRRRNEGEYARQLREKQRLRAQYFVSERQLRNTFATAQRRSGQTGEVLIELLERRLDATVLRAGLARTIYQARQLVGHGHILVDGRRVDRPAAHVEPGSVITVKAKSRQMPVFQEAIGREPLPRPGHLQVDQQDLRVTVLRAPVRAEIPVICDERLVVEFYSR